MCDHLHFINNLIALNVGAIGAQQNTSQKLWKASRLQLLYYFLKQAYFKNKGLYKINVIWLLYLAFRFFGFKYPLQSGSHWPLYLNMGGVTKIVLRG